MQCLNGVWAAVCFLLLAVDTSGCTSKPDAAPDVGHPQAFSIQRGGEVELGEGSAIEVDGSQPEQDCEDACRDALECTTSQGCTLLCAFTPERCRAEADQVIACVVASPDGDWTCDAITVPDDCQDKFETLNDCI